MVAALPDNLASILNGLDQRLSVLENTSRVGLNRIRTSQSTATFIWPGTATAWENGTALGALGTSPATWSDDLGGTGNGYPEVTVTTGKRALIIATGTVMGIGATTGGVFKGTMCALGVGTDGSDPSLVTSTRMSVLAASVTNPTLEIDLPLTFVGERFDLTPGQHTFKIWTNWVVTAGGNSSPFQLFYPQLTVIPIDIP